MEKWICCGRDIEALCEKAGTLPPPKCFFCGKVRGTTVLEPQPEDDLAFELAEIWCAKIREFHGDPETHVPSLDQYGRTDVEAWRAVARHVLEKQAPSIRGSSHYEIHSSLGHMGSSLSLKGEITLLHRWCDKDILAKLKGIGLLLTTEGHWIMEQGEHLTVIAPNKEHVLELIRTKTSES